MWLAIAVIGVMSWVASSVFHARDVEWTERMDYFCAQLYMASQVVGAVGRGFGPRAARWAVPPVLAAFVFHVAYLTILLPRFDYGWNMVVMISVGVCNCLSWLLWCWKNRASNPWTSYCAAIVVALLLTAGLEVLEFEPWWLAVDSHALWHFSTIPMSYAWYEFVRRDSLHHHAQLQMTGHRAE